MLNIGQLEMPGIAALAPMAGVSDAAMRLLCTETGAAWCVSEMLSAKGWILSKGKNENARALLRRFEGEGLAGLQLFGRDPEYVRDAALQLENIGFDFIDLNFGCPAPKITGNGEGSALMKEPVLIGKIVRAAADAIRKPLTVKIRSGWDSDCVNAVEVARICEENGAAAIAVHGRTTKQQYSGKADWGIIAAVKKACAVPVFGNGDIRCGKDALSMLEQTGCDAVLIARGAEGNPWIFNDINCALSGKQFIKPTISERVDMILRHMDLEVKLHGDRGAMLEMRKHIAWYIAGEKGAARFREKINTVNDPEVVRAMLKEFACGTYNHQS